MGNKSINFEIIFNKWKWNFLKWALNYEIRIKTICNFEWFRFKCQYFVHELLNQQLIEQKSKFNYAIRKYNLKLSKSNIEVNQYKSFFENRICWIYLGYPKIEIWKNEQNSTYIWNVDFRKKRRIVADHRILWRDLIKYIDLK